VKAAISWDSTELVEKAKMASSCRCFQVVAVNLGYYAVKMGGTKFMWMVVSQ